VSHPSPAPHPSPETNTIQSAATRKSRAGSFRLLRGTYITRQTGWLPSHSCTILLWISLLHTRLLHLSVCLTSPCLASNESQRAQRYVSWFSLSPTANLRVRHRVLSVVSSSDLFTLARDECLSHRWFLRVRVSTTPNTSRSRRSSRRRSDKVVSTTVSCSPVATSSS
jgi:hypothetical protein